MPRSRTTSEASCTPGTCTAMRFWPCRCTTVSATPSAFTRFSSAVMFCWIAKPCRSFTAASVSATVSVPGAASGCERQLRVIGEQRLARGIDLAGVAQRHVHRVAGDRDFLVLDARIAQLLAEVALEALQQLGDGSLGVDLVDEQHAAAQVEAEAHRLEAECVQPFRRAGGIGQRDGVLALVAGLDQVARLELVIHLREPGPQPIVVVRVHLLRRDTRRLEGAGHLRHGRRVEFRAVAPRQLQGRRFAVPVRKRKQESLRP